MNNEELNREIEELELKLQELKSKMVCYVCGRENIYAKGLCVTCYQRKLRTGDEYPRKRQRKKKQEKVEINYDWRERLYKIVFCDQENPELPCVDDLEESFDYVISGLSEKEQRVIELRYKNRKTLKEVGDDLGVSRERIRQIEARMFRKLRSPSRTKYLMYGINGVNERDEKLKQERLNSFEQMPNRSVDDYNLSVRAFNCLHRKGLKTRDDVLKYIAENGSLLNIRCIGKITNQEIYDKLGLTSARI